MTNEEANLTIDYLKEMQEGYIEGEGYERHPLPEWYALDKAIEVLEWAKWIPVSERMPKIAGIYRVTRYYPNNVMNPNYLVDACCFDGSNTWYDDNRINYDRAYADNVIAWQENPEPYKVEPQESEDKECTKKI